MGLVRPVEITAHRGSSTKAPENTLVAMRQSIVDGCDYIELDVQTCADGTIVVLHDRDLQRVAGDPRSVESLTLTKLKQIDVGRTFSAQFIGERVPTLAEVIALVRGRVKLNIELKFHRPNPFLPRSVMKLLCETHFLDQCFVSSMEVDALRECRATAPGVLTGRIITEPIDDVSQVEADILSVAASTINREFVIEAHCTGKEVHVWTVNEPTVMLNMIRNGVDNIITDRPDVLRTLLTQHYSTENHFNP